MARCQKRSQGSLWAHVIKEQGDLSDDWQPLQRKEFQSRLCTCKAIPPSLSLSHLFEKKHGAKKTKMWGPVPLCKREHRGQGFVLNSYVCSRGPSPCSRLCICTCMSLACCSRWRSCCSGSDLKSTHPHLKDNGNITTFSYWEQV